MHSISAVIDYLEKRPDVDSQRIGIMGRSFGGYWAAKMAFVEAKRLRASVVWGGGVHYFFQARLAARVHQCGKLSDGSRFGALQYLRCQRIWMSSSKIWPSLSLKTQGWLEKPSCPMLIVNGKEDLQTPIEDLHILLEYGTPKSARVFPGGHMGQTPETLPTVIRWLKNGAELIIVESFLLGMPIPYSIFYYSYLTN